MKKDLIKTFEELSNYDQSAIRDTKRLKLSGEELHKIQRENGRVVKHLLKVHGYPFAHIASQKADDGAFLTVQHSGDTKLIKNTITLLSTQNHRQDVRQKIAYLTDRLQIFQGKFQIYGTQYRTNSDGTIEFFSIKDMGAVDAMRSKAGLETLEEYKRKIQKNCKV